MQPRFINVPEMKIVGMETKFITPMTPDANNMVVIPALWQKYMPRRHEIKNIFQSFNLGICYDLPENKKSHPEEMLYVAGTEVTSIEDVPAGMQTYQIPAGEYAVFIHKGELEKFSETMKYIFGTWLPSSGRKLRNAPTVEFYDERFKLNQADSEVDVWIPVV